MKFSIKDDFFSKCDQIHSFLRIWSHLMKKSLMENFFFCAVTAVQISLKSVESNSSDNLLIRGGTPKCHNVVIVFITSGYRVLFVVIYINCYLIRSASREFYY